MLGSLLGKLVFYTILKAYNYCSISLLSLVLSFILPFHFFTLLPLLSSSEGQRMEKGGHCSFSLIPTFSLFLPLFTILYKKRVLFTLVARDR